MPHKDSEKARELARERSRNYRERNAEKVREGNRIRAKLFRKLHPEIVREWEARKYERHKEEIRKRALDWHYENSERHIEQMRLYRENHKEYFREYRRANRQRFREQQNVYQANRRAKKLLVGGKWTAQDIKDKYFSQNGRCFYCCVPIEKGTYHAEHIVPLAKGGTGHAHNLALSCATCNFKKGTRSAEDHVLRLVS